MTTTTLPILIALIFLKPATHLPDASPLTDADVQRLVAELQPDPSALWRTVPWKLLLMDAQAMAAERKQPLFIWAMDGHPLGCT